MLSAVEARAESVMALVLDDKGQPVADAVVFAYDVKEKPVPSKEPLAMDQVNKEFVPHQLAIVVGTQIRFPNKDDIHHEIYSFSAPKTFELPLYKGEPAAPVTFDKPGVVKLGCNIHDWMSGVVLVLPNKHFGTTDAGGKTEFDAPAGVDFAVFHERLKGSVDETLQRPKKGALSWTLKLKAEKKKKRVENNYQ